LVVVMLAASYTNAAPAHARRGRLRVSRPCSGRRILDSVNDVTTADSHRDNHETTNSVSHHQLRRAVRSVNNLIAALYDDVNRLKADYVSLCVCEIHIYKCKFKYKSIVTMLTVNQKRCVGADSSFNILTAKF